MVDRVYRILKCIICHVVLPTVTLATPLLETLFLRNVDVVVTVAVQVYTPDSFLPNELLTTVLLV